MVEYKDYQLRVIDEKNILKDKINKLKMFINFNSETYKKLDKYDKILLDEQLYFMKQYCNVLEERINRFS